MEFPFIPIRVQSGIIYFNITIGIASCASAFIKSINWPSNIIANICALILLAVLFLLNSAFPQDAFDLRALSAPFFLDLKEPLA